MKRLRLVWPMLLPATCTPCTLTISPLTHRLPSPAQYVELPELMAERAVQVLNHRNMGSRYVEVFLSSEGEMSQANVAPPVGASAPWQLEMGVGSGGIVRLRGLPFNATPDLILQFFTGYEVPKGPMGVHLILGPNGRPNGEAFVEFASEEVADAALTKDRATIGTRYVEVFRATPEQMGQALLRVAKSNNLAPVHMAQAGMHGMPYGFGPFAIPAHMMGGMGAMMAGPGADAVVKMRGLPYKVTRNDILDFFPGLSVPLNGVHLMFNEREQPTGEAYVEFSSPEDRERAMTKDRQHIGGRYVELFRVGRGEMLAALEQFVGGYMSNQMALPGGAPGMAYGGMYGGMQQSPYAQPPGFVGPPGTMGAPPGAYVQQHMAPGQPQGANGMQGQPKMSPGTLRMRGIPFRSTVDDVLRFFAGFQVMPGGVVLGQREGRATGDCYVTFSNPAEAQRAMVMNNKHMVRSPTIRDARDPAASQCSA
jgi:RNA recognition motif-containing protein